MDKQSLMIICIALIFTIWGGWITYNNYQEIYDGVIMWDSAVGQFGMAGAVFTFFLKIIPVLILVGGLGLLFLQKWGLRLVHMTVFIDIFYNGFKLGKYYFFGFTAQMESSGGVAQYFLDPAMFGLCALFIIELVILNLTMQLKNGLID